MRPGFEAMRARLRRRGLLNDAHQLTAEGRAYCDRLLARLPGRRKGLTDPSTRAYGRDS